MRKAIVGVLLAGSIASSLSGCDAFGDIRQDPPARSASGLVASSSQPASAPVTMPPATPTPSAACVQVWQAGGVLISKATGNYVADFRDILVVGQKPNNGDRLNYDKSRQLVADNVKPVDNGDGNCYTPGRKVTYEKYNSVTDTDPIKGVFTGETRVITATIQTGKEFYPVWMTLRYS